MVDYLGNIKDQARDDIERSAIASRALHDICKDLQISGLLIYSFNKGGMKEQSGLENLSGSGKVAYDADQVVYMTNHPENENEVVCKWKKMRDGDNSGYLNLIRVPGFPCFGEKAKGY